MENDNKHLDKVIDQLTASTRSPRGRFSAANSWKLLEERLHQQRRKRVFWLRAASSAAVVLLCMTSWAAYQALRPEPSAKQPSALVVVPQATATPPTTISFRQEPLQEVVGRLSEIYRTPIRIDDDSLRHYRMTATFSTSEGLTQTLNLLQQAAGNFTYTTRNDTIVITKLN